MGKTGKAQAGAADDLQRCGLWSTTANLAKVSLGSGILGLPAAVAAGKAGEGEAATERL